MDPGPVWMVFDTFFDLWSTWLPYQIQIKQGYFTKYKYKIQDDYLTKYRYKIQADLPNTDTKYKLTFQIPIQNIS